MRALRIAKPEGPSGLVLSDVPSPRPGPGEVLVRVRAAGLNRADLLQSMGRYPAPSGVPADIPGLEYAGEVASNGANAHRFAPGARVMGITGGAAFAEELVVHERTAIPIPKGLAFDQAAAIPEAFLTAYDALLQAEFREGESVMIHAVGSGVGTAAAQLASALGAAAVIGTSRTRDKLERAKAFGVTLGIEVGDPPAFSDRAWADVILDLVGAAYLPENLEALAPRGRLVQIGTLAGAKGELALGTLMTKRARVIGTVLRSRPVEEKIALTEAFERAVVPLFESGKLRPVLHAAYPFAEFRKAFEQMSSSAAFGKLVLIW